MTLRTGWIAALFLALLSLPIATAAAQTAASQPQSDADWFYRGSDIEPDPAWRFGTLANGVRYAVRNNPLPAGQVSMRVRIDAGALHERDEERGWAHFVEHMLFRGTENYPDRQARHIWQQLGANFGSDTNATTSATETVYQLDLPHAGRAQLDTSLRVLSEMMSKARFEPDAVAAEKRVVLAEKGRRPEIAARLAELARGLYYRGLLFAERDTIGTDETLNAASAEGLKSFYRRWYRPERATVVMVGDADPAMMEALIAEHFGGWRSEGDAPAEPDYGRLAEVDPPVANLAYPGVPNTISLAWLRPYEWQPHTMQRERDLLAELLAAYIVNRRLEAHARGDSAFISANVGASRTRNVAEATQLSIMVKNGRWEEALTQAFAIVSDALRAPPSAGEIDRELRNLRTRATSAVSGDAGILSQLRAQQLLNAINARAVVSSPATVLANFEANVPHMTPERVAAAMAAMFDGEGPRMILVSPEPVEGGETAMRRALAAAQAAAPAERRAERQVTMDDLPAPQGEGRETWRERIADMGVTIVRFANGSTLTHKQTDFDRGTVHVRLRFGEGQAGLAPDQPSLAWLGGLIGPSGIADLDLDAVERLMTGRRIALSFSIAEDAFVLGGQTNAGELGDQLRLLTAKLTHPRWDEALFQRFKTSALEGYDLHFSSAAARASREYPGVARPNDQRWQPVERERIAAVTSQEFRAYFEPLLAAGPVHAIIVGDVDLERAVEAMKRSVAALPPRPEARPAPGSKDVRPPAPNPEPALFTHQGDPDQAYALIGWSTLGGVDRTRERRALALAANMFQVRLFDRLREQEGATYSPNAVHTGSESFPDWGIFTAAAEVKPDHVDTFFRIAREIVADLARNPAAPDEFQRAQNPVVSGIERRLATNAYWVQILEDWIRFPQEIENARTYLEDYRSLTPEDVRRAVAAFVADEGDWSMVVLPARARSEREGS